MSLSLCRICVNGVDSIKRFVCYFLGVSNVEDLFQLFLVIILICVKTLLLCQGKCPCSAIIEQN